MDDSALAASRGTMFSKMLLRASASIIRSLLAALVAPSSACVANATNTI
jgi:hypothetical protein